MDIKTDLHRIAPFHPTSKPIRKDFTQLVIKAADGTEVPKESWSTMVAGVKPRSVTRVLKHRGLTVTAVFDKDKYLEARKQYRYQTKHQVIDVAFKAAGIDHEPHLDKALKSLLPIFQETSPKHTAVVLKNIIRTVYDGILAKKAEPAVAA